MSCDWLRAAKVASACSATTVSWPTESQRVATVTPGFLFLAVELWLSVLTQLSYLYVSLPPGKVCVCVPCFGVSPECPCSPPCRYAAGSATSWVSHLPRSDRVCVGSAIRRPSSRCLRSEVAMTTTRPHFGKTMWECHLQPHKTGEHWPRVGTYFIKCNSTSWRLGKVDNTATNPEWTAHNYLSAQLVRSAPAVRPRRWSCRPEPERRRPGWGCSCWWCPVSDGSPGTWELQTPEYHTDPDRWEQATCLWGPSASRWNFSLWLNAGGFIWCIWSSPVWLRCCKCWCSP